MRQGSDQLHHFSSSAGHQYAPGWLFTSTSDVLISVFCVLIRGLVSFSYKFSEVDTIIIFG